MTAVYERMLDRSMKPTMGDMAAYCGERSGQFERLNAYLRERYQTAQEIRFPYGNSYGWCVSHRLGKKLVCDVFAEAGSFTVMLRLANAQFDEAYGHVTEYTRRCIDGKYPCGEGGWIHYRVLCDEHLADAERMLDIKCSTKRK